MEFNSINEKRLVSEKKLLLRVSVALDNNYLLRAIFFTSLDCNCSDNPDNIACCIMPASLGRKHRYH